MRAEPTAFGYVDDDHSGEAAQWHRAQVTRLARRLGYVLIWPPPESPLPLIDQVRETDVDAVVMPSTAHVDALTLDLLLHLCDVETVRPRMTLACCFVGAACVSRITKTSPGLRRLAPKGRQHSGQQAEAIDDVSVKSGEKLASAFRLPLHIIRVP